MAKIKSLIRSTPMELIKGAIKGQMIRISNPKRYRELKKIRGNKKKLRQEKRRLIELIRNSLHYAGIKPIKIYGRIKTLGSLDRKEKYARKRYKENAKDFIKEDLIGITIIVKSKKEAYSVLNSLKRIGVFPKLKVRPNPRDYFEHAKEVRRPEVKTTDALIGNLKVGGTIFHVRIMTPETQERENIGRRSYKKRIKKAIEEK
jgi:hypothetical protein